MRYHDKACFSMCLLQCLHCTDEANIGRNSTSCLQHDKNVEIWYSRGKVFHTVRCFLTKFMTGLQVSCEACAHCVMVSKFQWKPFWCEFIKCGLYSTMFMLHFISGRMSGLWSSQWGLCALYQFGLPPSSGAIIRNPQNDLQAGRHIRVTTYSNKLYVKPMEVCQYAGFMKEVAMEKLVPLEHLLSNSCSTARQAMSEKISKLKVRLAWW